MIPGGSNKNRLANIDTRNCYICQVAQYLASRKALLRTSTYALVIFMITVVVTMLLTSLW